MKKLTTWCFGEKEQTDANKEANAVNPENGISNAINRPFIEKLHKNFKANTLPTTMKNNKRKQTLPNTSKNERIHFSIESNQQASSGNRVSSLRLSGISASNASDPHAFDLERMRASKVVVKKELTEEDSRKLVKSINAVDYGYDEELQILRTSQAIAKPKVAPSRSGTQEDPLKFDLRV